MIKYYCPECRAGKPQNCTGEVLDETDNLVKCAMFGEAYGISHAERETPRKEYRCKHCKVQVVSKTNFKAVLGKTHGKHCPRRFL